MQSIKRLVDTSLIVVAASQCLRGKVDLGVYSVGKALFDIGVIGAGDMTPECVVTKLAYLLSKKLSKAEITKAMMANLRGELGQTDRNAADMLLNPFGSVNNSLLGGRARM